MRVLLNKTNIIVIAFTCLLNLFGTGVTAQRAYREPYRPKIHFSPRDKWMNDPNGMVFYKDVYHLFFQFHPKSTVWGPMHWGHATSNDLVHWRQEPIALYPDSLGYIFSGSSVMDFKNTSGFGKNGEVPMVAIFTYHDPKKAKENKIDHQNQGIAYSTDEGKTWIKYAGNPVLKNPGIADFRDPKVMWYEAANKWIMTLAVKDRIMFYSSTDLKQWKKESEFGKDAGAHGGVWECPDLFMLDDNGKPLWVLLVSINPGGPNKGSATQYFIGDFDGNKFVPLDTETKWLDFGPDNYAGVTWSNTGNRKIFLGWMSNWIYANEVPSVKWRSAMTLPRDLTIKRVGEKVLVASNPVPELSKIGPAPVNAGNINVTGIYNMASAVKTMTIPFRINFTVDEIKDFSLMFSNTLNEQTVIGYDKKRNQYYIDRTRSGNTDFKKEFASTSFAPRLTDEQKMNFSVIIDESSVELFADDGLTVMTGIFFPSQPYTLIDMLSKNGILFKKVEYTPLKSIWP
ncbi:MAG: glycoside hydrolase family 32 protein [Ferruginibacter sp.]